MTAPDPYDQWIGREENASDEARPSDLDRFNGIFGASPLWNARELPALAHWMLFPAIVPQDSIGPDGHPKRGGFLPPIDHLPRRMWTGSSLNFLAPVPTVEQLVRRSEIKKISPKTGGSGELVFVKVAHTTSDSDGNVLVEETQDIVYRGMGAGSTPPSAPTEAVAVSETVRPDPVLLFRYSAATFNGHRIHYDRPYAKDEEGYRGLVVHGPLTATLLLRLACRATGKKPTRFAFRAASPAFDGEDLHLRATAADAKGMVTCWAENTAGHLIMSAEATFSIS